ncbi:hypothetical protein PAUR_a3744 [Pseudoalteromonas aurantia 208]|uniref:Uncharacterized protein n=1 Tax=Pseudoalteromonas aurantia 208 TaxID=1314867 RepID=A0ABR9E6S3_9GAMM|nr:hypothetical protein [Pseudoalteromonas aurantia 208]
MTNSLEQRINRCDESLTLSAKVAIEWQVMSDAAVIYHTSSK